MGGILSCALWFWVLIFFSKCFCKSVFIYLVNFFKCVFKDFSALDLRIAHKAVNERETIYLLCLFTIVDCLSCAPLWSDKFPYLLNEKVNNIPYSTPSVIYRKVFANEKYKNEKTGHELDSLIGFKLHKKPIINCTWSRTVF